MPHCSHVFWCEGENVQTLLTLLTQGILTSEQWENSRSNFQRSFKMDFFFLSVSNFPWWQ